MKKLNNFFKLILSAYNYGSCTQKLQKVAVRFFS